MSFFVADNKIPIQQKSIGIPAINGLAYNPEQQVDFYIDPQQVKFFNPKQSTLQFDIKIQMPSDTNGELARLMLDSHIGAQSVISEIRIFDGANNALLEEIVGYNVATSVKYDYHTNDSLRNKRALTEGAGQYKPDASQGTLGSTISYQNCAENFYSVSNVEDTQSASLVNASYLNCRVNLPLNTGIFSNDKIFPTMLTSGLRISLLLSPAVRCIRQLEGSMLNRKTNLNPVLHSQNGCGVNTGAGSGSYVKDTNASKVFIANMNQYNNPERCPFVVGEALGFWDLVNESYLNVCGTLGDPIIKEIKYDATTSLVEITTTTFQFSQSVSAISNASNVLFSKSVDNSTTFNATYQLNNVEMILEVVDMGSQYESDMMRKMKEGGTINYDFLSLTNYRYSQLASDIVANIQLPIENRRMRSIISVPTDSSVYTMKQVLNACGTYEEGTSASATNNDYKLFQDRCGLVGCSDNITSYQFLYNGKLNPSRLVNCEKTSSKVSVSQQPLIELEKALSSADMPALSLLEFNKNFIIGRSLTAGQNGTYDGRGKQFALQVNYNGTTPTKNKLWNNFVYHIRRLVIKGDSIFVEV
tara:strand:+ start:649 stop:2409 length:1761 start_codon:yes stop_codon:yes gene_type:complete